MRVVISGGGTGGHIYPALAIAEELRARNHQVLYIGGPASAEQDAAEQFGFIFKAVQTAPLHRKSLKVIGDLAANLRGTHQAEKIVAEFAPDVAIGTGGFVTAPVLLACQRSQVPTIIHEQNAYPGLANRRLAKKAEAVCLTFTAAKQYFACPDKTYHTGLPVRTAILDLSNKPVPEAAYQYFGIDKEERELPTLLITGGSQGAKTLNDAMLAAYQQLLAQNIRIIHLCGKSNFFELKQKAPANRHLHLLPYLDNMEYALAIANLALARSGASFLAEAAVLALPLILVPYPHATNDHQSANAEAFFEADAALVVKDSELTGSWLTQTVPVILNNPQRLWRMQEGARSLAKTQAASDIADIAEAKAKKQ